MYAILKVIYGHPITEKECGDEDDTPIGAAFLDETTGCLEYYSGSGDFPPRAFGIKLDTFDECEVTEVADLKLTPTADQLKEYQDNFNALPEDAQQAIKALGAPRVFFLPTTS